MVGRTVSHYQIIEQLGKGGMGDIYKALDPRLNRFVAIKVLPASMSSDPARRRRFVQEAQAASGLNHPNIITIYDVVLEQETEFMLMEYVAGKTLLDLIPNGGLRVPQVLNYSVQMADALSAAHAAGIIHRDLKPGNIMVTDAGLVKVLDFGLAKFEPVSASDETETVMAQTLTVEGSILGTVNYMSPEQAEGFRVDARSDIFSFGVLLYEMLTGVRPFIGESPISTMSAILRDEARPVGEITPGIPLRLQELIARCLRKNPDDRWQSMQEVRAVLVGLKQESDSGQSSATEVPAPKRLPGESRRGSRAALLVVLGVVALGAVGAWWFTRRPAPAVRLEMVPAAPAKPALPDRPSPFVPAQPPPAAAKAPDTSAALPATPTPEPLPVHAAITLVDGSPLSLTLTEDIPANASEGTPLHFTVSKEVEVAGAVAVRKGALVSGEVAQEGKKKLLVFGPKMMMRLLTVEAADGHSLKVRATPGHPGQLGRPVDVGGKAKPKGVAAVAGTQYVGYIDGDQSLGMK